MVAKLTIGAVTPPVEISDSQGTLEIDRLVLGQGYAQLSPVVSPHGGDVTERQLLQERFSDRFSVGIGLSRRLVSYQGNKEEPGLRWMKYKEGFTRKLVKAFIDDFSPDRVLDPFSGIGTTALTASGMGICGTGIEIMPVGVTTARAIAAASNGLIRSEFEATGEAMLDRIASTRKASNRHMFKHVRITGRAFSESTESDLAKAREFIDGVNDDAIAKMLDFACMSVLEEVSYTRKDGQYLRWDYRSGRKLRSRVNKGTIRSLLDALAIRLVMISDDIDQLGNLYGSGKAEFIEGSCLRYLRSLKDASYDMVITSPPYANRYDYTRTYALELAWLGLGQTDFSALRQEMISATVENRPKRDWLGRWYGSNGSWSGAIRCYESQSALREVLTELKTRRSELSNSHVIRLIEGYFLEMAYVIAELARIVKPGGEVVMVNDNVQYHGEQVPVDLILSDFAEMLGFECTNIWMLPRGKGNSSQQMGRFGRTEIRKCVYKWRRLGG